VLKEIPEYQARGEIERVYHEIKQVLRVSGVSLLFRVWAGYGELLPVLWDAARPNLETLAFEEAAGRLRAEGVREAAGLGSLEGLARVPLGPSQQWQVRAALDLYHYINPKLLLLTSAAALALEGNRAGSPAASGEPLMELGTPEGMYPMEMVAEDTENPLIAEVFRDIRKTLGLKRVNSDYRTLALWPHYLAAAWERLKPIALQVQHSQAAERLWRRSRELARTLPLELPFSPQRLEAAGERPRRSLKLVRLFEQLLPGLILNMALIALTWQPAGALVLFPFPAKARGTRVVISGGRA
jgi:hypothetical protein